MAARPIYAELSDELIREIRTGARPVGMLLPTELEIAANRGVSRSTVRAALNRLAALGLVTRQKGVGTRVAAIGPSAYGASIGTIEELAHFGAATERRVLQTLDLVVDEALAERIDCRPGTRWVRVRVVRTEPGDATPPICWTDNYVSSPYVDVVPDIAEHRGLIAELIETRYGVVIEEVVQLIRPIILGEEAAVALKAPAGSTALEIVRRYRSADTLIYASVSQHPSDRFEYRMTLHRQVE